MSMIVRYRDTYTIKPETETWSGYLPLSELDQIDMISHWYTIYFYKPPSEWLHSADAIFNTLRASLRRVLVPFYPLAGRLERLDGGRLRLDCNAMGVWLIEAESEGELNDLGDFCPGPDFEQLMPSLDYTMPIHEQPLLLVQVTKFRRGGLALSLAISHVVADGLSAAHFYNEWARLARGEPLNIEPYYDRKCGGLALSLSISHVVADGLSAAHFFNEWAQLACGEPLNIEPYYDRKCGGLALSLSISHVVADGLSAAHFFNEWAQLACGEPLNIEPYYDRKVLWVGEDPSGAQLPPPNLELSEFNHPPLLIGHANNLEQRMKKTALAMLKVTKTQVETLKNAVNKDRPSHHPRPYTRFETIAAHIWRCVCKARKHKSEQATSLYFYIDARSRLRPPLKPGFFGNAVFNMVAGGTSGELVSSPLRCTSSVIREAIEAVTHDHVKSAIEHIRRQPDLTTFQDLHAQGSTQGVFYGNPNLRVSCWLTLPLNGLDFGWGREIHMGLGNHDLDADFVVLPGHEEAGGLVVAVCLQTAHIEDFKKFFYEDIVE